MIAIIPARLGSKRLPRKNILPLCGKPLIAHTLEAALGAHVIEEIFVSTDDEEVVDIARSYGAKVPFRRPEELCSDTASTEDVCEHMLNFIAQEKGEMITSFMLLQATSPLRTSEHIDDAFRIFNDRNADAVIGVTKFAHPVQWALKIDGGVAVPCDTRALGQRSQNLDERYHPNGAVYMFKTEFFLKRTGYYGPNTYPFIMERECSIDIDMADDFELAAYYLQKRA